MPKLEPFSVRFVKARRLAGLSIAQAAVLCSVTTRTITSWESGEFAPVFDDANSYLRTIQAQVRFRDYYPVISAVRDVTEITITPEQALHVVEAALKTPFCHRPQPDGD